MTVNNNSIQRQKVALITGVTGQDGAYLSELLLSKGYIVHGIKRRSSLFNTERIDHLYKDPHNPESKFFLHYGDMTDSTNMIRVIQQVQPDEIYNLGAQSHVQVSFETPEYTSDADGLGALRILEAIRILNLEKKVRFYQASSSELYGLAKESPQKETTPFYPRSPYAVAKLYAYWITVNYREAYNLFACNGILFNHESPIRGETFVTRKITRGVSRIAVGLEDKIYIGKLDAKRDWGHAKDYVLGMWLMLQQDTPDDYILATGVSTSVRELLELAFREIGINIEWCGRGENTVGKISGFTEDVLESVTSNRKKGDIIVETDPKYFRPTEVDSLCGDASKAKNKLGWNPKYDLASLVKEMIQSDLRKAEQSLFLRGGGFKEVICLES